MNQEDIRKVKKGLEEKIGIAFKEFDAANRRIRVEMENRCFLNYANKHEEVSGYGV